MIEIQARCMYFVTANSSENWTKHKISMPDKMRNFYTNFVHLVARYMNRFTPSKSSVFHARESRHTITV